MPGADATNNSNNNNNNNNNGNNSNINDNSNSHSIMGAPLRNAHDVSRNLENSRESVTGSAMGSIYGDSSNSVLPRPGHVILNHIYLDKASSVREVIVLGTTHRYKAKYVTQLHYKPQQR